MAFTRSTLAKLAGSSGHNLWVYKTDDAAATVDTAGYFNEAVADFNIGDLIFRITLSAGALSTCGWHVVKDLTSTTVDVTDATAATVTDID